MLLTLSCFKLRNSTLPGIWSTNLHPNSQNKAGPLFLDKPCHLFPQGTYYRRPRRPSPQASSSLPLWNTKRLLTLPGSEEHSDLGRRLLGEWPTSPSSQMGPWQQDTAPHPMTHLNHTCYFQPAPSGSKQSPLCNCKHCVPAHVTSQDTAQEGQIWVSIVQGR